jgi:hypothetical protein
MWHCLGMRDEIVRAVERGITVYQEGTLPVVSSIFRKFYSVSALWQETVFKFHKETGLKKHLLLIFSVAISFQMTSVY